MEDQQENIAQQLQLVSYGQALALKELGFDWKVPDHFHENIEQAICESHYEPDNYNSDDWGQDYVSRPTVPLALKWLRKVYQIHIYTYQNAGKDGYNISIERTSLEIKGDCPVHLRSYEENDMAESMAINVVLDYLIKEKTHSIRVEISETRKDRDENIIKVGNVVFFTWTESVGPDTFINIPFETQSVILRGMITYVEKYGFRAQLIDNNNFEKDGNEYVIHNGSLLANQNFTDFDRLGKWYKNK